MWGLIWIGDLSVDEDDSLRSVFPMFRGVGLLILYVWVLAWNVFVWSTFNINYKLIFEFNYHSSTFSEILTRASIFTAILLLMFLWFIILREDYADITDIFRFLPKEFTPLIVWISFLGYIFFPSFEYFNPQGRLYMFKVLKETVMSPFTGSSFRVIRKSLINGRLDSLLIS
jgi:hypothetical protein